MHHSFQNLHYIYKFTILITLLLEIKYLKIRSIQITYAYLLFIYLCILIKGSIHLDE